MSLFHTPEFVRLNGLTILRKGELSLLLGPERGTYGGFSAPASLAEMAELLACIQCPCTIKLAPASHDIVLFSRSMNAMHRAGFMLEHVDLNYDLRPLNIDFAAGLADGARKKLAKCDRAGFHSRDLERREWERAYALIYANRKRVGRVLSLPHGAILALEAALPRTYRFFATFDGNRMIAAAICVMVRHDVMYVYSWADAEKNEFSPTVHLCRAIYEEAAFMGCRLLDAGISTENGVPNNGLIRFKESLGFLPSAKVTMRRA